MTIIGEVLKVGEKPCSLCLKVHDLRVTEVRIDGSVQSASWKIGGHDYKQISDTDYIKILKDKIRRLESKKKRGS